jgi:hypothetical protein
MRTHVYADLLDQCREASEGPYMGEAAYTATRESYGYC